MTTRIGSLHDLAAAIRGRRQELGLSQAQLASRARLARVGQRVRIRQAGR